MAQRVIPAARQIRRLSRRRLVAGAGSVGALLAVSAAACSTNGKGAGSVGKQGTTGSPAAQQPKNGGSLNYAGGAAGSFDTQGVGFDPQVVSQSTARNMAFVYERLLAYNIVTYAIEPELAQKWEQPSSTQYIFHLQPNVKWHNKPPANGRSMTADDVLWSFQRAQTDDPKFSSRSLLTLVDKIDAPDATTIRVTMKEPDASTLNKLANENLSIICREVFEKFTKFVDADSVVGTGAFTAKTVEQNVGNEYDRNPTYWKPGLPYLDSFHSRSFADSQTAYAAFVSNQVDVALLGGPDTKSYIQQQGQGYVPAWGADDTTGAIIYPNTRVKPMDDARVTSALRLLIDHDEMIASLAIPVFGRGGYGSIFPPSLSSWDLTQEEYKTHLEWKQPKDDAAREAISLLSAAGFTKDKPLKFEIMANNNPPEPTGAQLLQAQWKRLSGGIIDVDLKIVPVATSTALRNAGTWTYTHTGQSAGPGDPELWLSSSYRTHGSLNYSGMSDSQLDAMIDKQRTIFDDKQRKAAVRSIILYMIDHSPTTIGSELYYLHATKPKVHGYQPETHYLNGRLFSTVWLDT